MWDCLEHVLCFNYLMVTIRKVYKVKIIGDDMAILNPFEGLEGTLNDINLFYLNVEEDGSDYSIKRLRETVETAKTKFDCLTKEEREAAKNILRVKYPEDVTNGDEFDRLYHLIEEVQSREDWDPAEEDLQDYNRRKFGEYRVVRNMEFLDKTMGKIYSGLSMIVIGILGNRLDNGGEE